MLELMRALRSERVGRGPRDPKPAAEPKARWSARGRVAHGRQCERRSLHFRVTFRARTKIIQVWLRQLGLT